MAEPKATVRLRKPGKIDGKRHWCRLALDSKDRLHPDRTVYNKFELLMSFLKANKVPRLVTAKDRPKYTWQEVDVYEAEELSQLFAHRNLERRVLFRFLLGSAAREQEAVFTAWINVDLKNGLWHVRAKPELVFKTRSTY